jgi:hypothetical protein
MIAFCAQKTREAEAEQRRQEEAARHFPALIPVLYKNRVRILEDPQFYFIELPSLLFIMGDKPPPVFLGQLLEQWDTDPVFSEPCDCGGKALLYALNLYPSHRFKCRWHLRCPTCGKEITVKKDPNNHRIHAMYSLAQQVKPEGLVSSTLAELEEF